MKYPVAFISLSDDANIPSLDYLSSISNTTDVAFWRHADEVPPNFDEYLADYTPVVQATKDLTYFDHGSQVIAVVCDQIPLLLMAHFSEHIVGIYWVKDVPTSFDIQLNHDLVNRFTNIIEHSENRLMLELDMTYKKIKSKKVGACKSPISETLIHLLDPTWEALAHYYAQLLQHNQHVCIP